jgi:uncharacterized protein YfcZ (UPF0381/DUF406 family)
MAMTTVSTSPKETTNGKRRNICTYLENNDKASEVTYLFLSDKECQASLKRILIELQT